MDKDENELEPNHLVMRFDPNTIEHLGIKMYSTLPPVIAEMVSNSYDAEAELVKIYLYDEETEKKIIIEDNGTGMSFEEINNKFLLIGRNRREDSSSQKSKNDKRLVIGKKGIGKLSFFGISKQIQVETTQDGKRNIFLLNWDELKNSGKERDKKGNIKSYTPHIIEKDNETKEASGTKIILFDIQRKTSFSPDDIAYALSRSFQVFDEVDFNVKIYHNNLNNVTDITNSLKYKNIAIDFEWTFPLSPAQQPKEFTYNLAEFISGKVLLTKETVSSDMKGIALFSRNKLVNEHEFYGVKATSHGYSYLTGNLNVDFIDMFKDDVISTNRRSLNWETEETKELQIYLELVIRKIYNESTKIKEKKKLEEVEKLTGLHIEVWIGQLPAHEKKLAQKIVNAIIISEGISAQKGGERIKFVKDSFQFEAFKELATEIDKTDIINTEALISLFKEWKLIEARELYKLALGRIKTIEKFEQYIKTRVNEVPTMHNFLKQFSWLLDPRIIEFKDEIYYSQLLKEKYNNDINEPLEANRRIDFLCTGLGNNFFVIELKKPEFKIRAKDIYQAIDYRSFIQKHFGNSIHSYKTVIAYVVTGYSNDEDAPLKDLIDAYSSKGTIFVKTYHELLTNAKSYHKEFIDRYEALEKSL
jgi:hypothetical protein